MSETESLIFPDAAPPASVTPPAAVTAAPLARREKRSLLKAYMELGKVRLSAMVVVTTALGFIVSSAKLTKTGSWELMDWARLGWTCLGTFLAAVGASAINQVMESRRDARMLRTRTRPIPNRDLSRTHALNFGLMVAMTGVAILCPKTNGLTAMLAAANVVLYAAIYTPMKPLTTANTLVGAVVGALPPMIGWAAAAGQLTTGAYVRAAILFAWQIPHFLALAWMYRHDYARGGYKMISTVEPTGRLTTLLSLIYALALIPLSLTMMVLGHAGWPFAVTAIILGAALVAVALRFAATRLHADARRLFLASVLYLPLLCAALALDARGRDDGLIVGPAGVSHPGGNVVIDPSYLK